MCELKRLPLMRQPPLFMFVLIQTLFVPLKGLGALTATHTVTAIQTFVTSAAAYCYVPAGVAGWCIALHAFGGGIYRINAVGWFYMCRAVLRFCRLRSVGCAHHTYITQLRFALANGWGILVPWFVAQVL